MTLGARPVTRELVAEALLFLPPDVDRETWVRIGMAVKSELGESAFDLFDDWSRAAESYKVADVRDTWRSFKPGGRVTIGTLFGLAKDHGFRFPERNATQAPAELAAAKVEHEQLARTRANERELEAAKYRARADVTAREAVRMWDQASEQGTSAYLTRKGVRAHGVRFLADGTLLVPVRDAEGALQNLQRIAGVKPRDDAPEKRFLPGGRKTGCMHWCGDPAGAPVILLAEGYATAASLHEASGRPVAIAFDAGNLVHVAEALCMAWPGVPLLVCGDDDRETAARVGGKNVGRLKAEAAVRVAHKAGISAGSVFPEGLAEGLTDFNDLATAGGAADVARIVEAACEQLLKQPPPAAKSAQGGRGAGGDGGKGGAGAVDAAGDDSGPSEWDPFSVTEEGVWHTARDAEGNHKKPQWLCTPLHVNARTRADDASAWGLLLTFADPDRNQKTWAMPSALLAGDGIEWAVRLRDMGLRIAPGTQPRNLVARYIDTRNPPARVTCTDRVGWHGSVFVLPGGTIGTAEGRSYVFQSDTGMEDTFRRRGTLAQWQIEVGALCVGNSRPVFSVCCALAGPALRLVGMEGGGFHMRGDSSIGKTTGLKIAASVWGPPAYMQRWRTTDNALEATAVQHSDGLLILDEIGQIDGRVLGECAYMLANGQEKGRATRSGLARKKRTWLNLFLSAGEVSMADHMAEAGKRARAGQEVRMLDVPIDAGRGMGGIEELHGHATPAAIAEAMVSAAARHYGALGRAWLEWACENYAELGPRLQILVDDYRDQLVPAGAAEQVRRAGNRFALVAAAGHVATEAGLTGWPAGQALWGVRECFNAWLAARGHLDNGEDAAMLRQVRAFLEAHGEGRFSWFHRAMDDHTPKTLHRAGFRRLLAEDGKPVESNADHQREFSERMSSFDGAKAQVEFLVLPEIFRTEVCRGFDPEAVARLLQRRGHLEHDKGRLTKNQRLPGIGQCRCYHVKPSIFAEL